MDARTNPQVSTAAAATTGISVTRGGIWNAAANLTPQLCAMAISIAGARFLGPSGLGRQSFIAFVVATSLNLFGIGLPVALMRTVGEAVGAERRAETQGLVLWAWRIGVACAALAGGVILGIAGGGSASPAPPSPAGSFSASRRQGRSRRRPGTSPRRPRRSAS